MMIGSGLFLNTIVLESLAPSWSFMAYALVGILMFPLAIVCFKLLNAFPKDSLYDLGKRSHPALGFFMSWGYFFGKLTTVAIGILLCARLLTQCMPLLTEQIIAYALVVLCTFLITTNIKLGKCMGMIFFIAKMIPIVFLISASLIQLIFQPHQVVQESVSFSQLSTALLSCFPFIIFSFAGFEAFFSVASLVENAKKNAARVVLIGFFLVLIICVLYQGSLMVLFGKATSSFKTFDALFKFVSVSIYKFPLIYLLLIVGIALSALGAAYSVLYSNMWNFYFLAKKNILPGSSILMRMNFEGIPNVVGLIAGMIVFLYVMFFSSSITLLQQISALVTFVTYVCCVYLYTLSQKTDPYYWLTVSSATISCLILCVGMMYGGAGMGYFIYGIFLILGAIAYYFGSNKKLSKI